MINERIKQILEDHTQHPMKAIEGLLPEITRLQALVHAQKEYIELLADRYAGTLTIAAPHGYQESEETMEKGIKLRVKIKSLEK